MSDLSSPAPVNSRKLPSSTIVNSDRPTGRDSAKKHKATQFVVEKVTEGVAGAFGSHQPPSLKSLEEGLAQANDAS